MNTLPALLLSKGEILLLIEMIRMLRTGNSKVMEEIYKKMYPLLAAEASKTHFMEYDDAMQEYCFALFLALRQVRELATEAQALAYCKTVVRHHFCKLYRSYVRKGKAEYAEEELPERICHDGEIERILLETALRRELQGFTEKKRNILAKLYLSGETETAVAQKYAVSRQYVNRLKREFRVQAEQYLC